MTGLIVALNCGMYSVNAEGIIYHVSARGLFRLQKRKPIVGDYVELDESGRSICAILERKSYLKRPLIANASQLIIVESLTEPDFSYLLAFKYLTYANMNGLNAKIILTKSDKIDDSDKIKEIVSVFSSINVPTFVISNKTKEGIEEVKQLFANNITCLIGQTGVGKSSLLNAIEPNYEREIGMYSKALGRGKHQTKEVVLLPHQNGYIADTPGFSSLELDLCKEDLAKYYPLFIDKYTECYFSNCLHISEHKCAVKEALNEGHYPPIIYDCYIKLSNEAMFKKKRY